MKSPRTFPKLVMKDWPRQNPRKFPMVELRVVTADEAEQHDKDWAKALSEFTRVCTDMKILDADKIAE